MKILIAEDDATSRLLLKLTLKRQGYEVIVTKDGAEAWSILQQPNAPSLVILDWMMPNLDGVEVCRRIRALEKKRRTYIILLTALAGSDNINKGLAAGVDDYLTKPLNQDLLRSRIKLGKNVLSTRNTKNENLEIFKKSILIVESDLTSRLVLTSMIKKLGYETKAVCTGEEAIQFLLAEKEILWVVLVNQNLIDMSGQTLLEKMHKHIPKLIAVLIGDKTDFKDENQELCMKTVLQKPVQKTALETCLSLVFKMAKL